MNWLLSFLFYFFLLFQYLISGEVLLQFLGYKKTWGMRCITGFFFLFFLSFLVAFPCQVLMVSWDIYVVAFSILLLLSDCLFLFYFKRHYQIKDIKAYRFSMIPMFKNFFKTNWLGILFVCVFTLFSISNLLPLYQLNYDDFYYIGKMTNLVESPMLMNEDYYSGIEIARSSIPIYRLINTYELTYAYFGFIFKIDLTFFCRLTMTFHNYLLFYLVYKNFAKLFINESESQYVILPFFIFLIPHGYLQSGLSTPINNLSIQSFDLWQFQTAAFYGGSIVRMLSIPVLLIYSIPLFKKLQIKKILWLAIVSISFVSFSSIFIQIFILYFLIVFIVFFLNNCIGYFIKKGIKNFLINFVGLLSFTMFLLSSKVWDHLDFIYTDNYLKNLEQFGLYDKVWFENDIILFLAPIILLITFILYRKQKNSRLIVIFLSIIVAMIVSSWFYEFFTITSFNSFFVSNRTVASIQYMIVTLFGILFVNLILKLFSSRNILIYLSSLFIFSVITFFNLNENQFLKYSYMGSGISEYGWDFSHELRLDSTMNLSIYNQVGAYFNSLSYGNYQFYSSPVFKYNGKLIYEEGFLMSSNRIQLSCRGGNPLLDSEENKILDDFCQGSLMDEQEIINLILDNEIDYILVQDDNNAKFLIDYGFEEVLNIDNTSGDCKLIKIINNI